MNCVFTISLFWICTNQYIGYIELGYDIPDVIWVITIFVSLELNLIWIPFSATPCITFHI